MKYKIGIFGSGGTGGKPTELVEEAARAIGRALGDRSESVIAVTGGCSGMPYLAAEQAAKSGAEVWGYSPVHSVEEQAAFTPNDNLDIYTKLQFVPEDLPFSANQRICMKYRNVLSTSQCDAGIIIAGSWGSLNEFTNLVDMQKTVGVLTGTGGVADELPALAQKIKKDGQGEIIFSSDPKQLVKELLAKLQAIA